MRDDHRVADPDVTAVQPPAGPSDEPSDESSDTCGGPSSGRAGTRANPRAWQHVAGWGGLAFVVLSPVAVLVEHHHRDQHHTSYVVLTVLVTCAAITATCGALAHRSTTRWSWWLYPPIVILPAATIVALTYLAPDRLDPAASASQRSLTAPDQAGSWRLQSNAATDARARELQAQVARADEGLVTVYGEYHRSGGDLLIYNGLNAGSESALLDELATAPSSALQDYLDQTGVQRLTTMDPGDLGGALVCGTIARLGPYVDLPVCGWADAAGIGRATYRVDGINLDVAAGLTRDFRAAVTRVG